jgi:hypothetical protein
MSLSKANRLRSAVVLFTSVALMASMAQVSSASAPTAEASTPVAPVTEAPDRASAAEAAARQGTPVESLEDRTETSTTWVNSDGTLKTDMFGAPIRYKDASGAWRDVDVSLEVRPDGTVAPKAHPEALKFAPAGGTADTVQKLASLDGGEVVLGWKGHLPTPVIDGFTATYPEVEPGVDLVLTATRTGFEQYFVIKERPQPGEEPTFHLPVVADDVTVEETAQGGLALVDETGQKVAAAPAPMMWGDDIDPKSGEPSDQAVVDLTVAHTATGAEVVLQPEPAFLADPSVSYPLVVDPAVTVYTSADTLIQNDYASNQNGGTELKAGSYNGGTTKARSLIKFDVTDLKAPTGSTTNVIDADFLIYNFYSSSCTKTPVGLHKLTSSWSPSSVTWSSGAPTHIQTPIQSVVAANGYNANCPDGYVHFNNDGVRSLVEGWANGTSTNYGVMVKAGDESDSLSWKRFHSADYGGVRVPRISVTYNMLPYQPAGRSITPCLSSCSGIPVTDDPRPTLSGDARDPDGGSVRMDFEIWDGGTQTPTVKRTYGNTTVSTTPNVITNAKWTPAVDLPVGTYGYRVRAWDGTDYGPWSAGYTIFTVTNTAPSVATQPMTSQSSTSSPGSVCTTGTDRPTIATTTPTLNALVNDVDLAGEEQTRFTAEVWAINGTAPVVSGTAAYGPQAVANTWTVPAGSLANGGVYKWRALGSDGTQSSPAWSEWCEFRIDTALAPAFGQAASFSRTYYEHLVTGGPTASESGIRTTTAGQSVVADRLADQDAARSEMAASGLTISSVTSSMVVNSAETVSPDSTVLHVGTPYTQTQVIAGETDYGYGSDDWDITLKLVDGVWTVDNVVQVTPEIEDDGMAVNSDLQPDEVTVQQAGSYTGLNMTNAIAYAVKWSQPYVNKYGQPLGTGKSHPGDPVLGNNCQNFVSQVMRAGGWAQTWYGQPNYAQLGSLPWYSNGYDSSVSFRVVNSFAQVLQARGARLIYRGSEVPIGFGHYSEFNAGPIMSKLRVGDIIMYDYEADLRLNHAQIVTKVQNGVAFISQNSSWIQNGSFQQSFRRAKNKDNHPGALGVFVFRP